MWRKALSFIRGFRAETALDQIGGARAPLSSDRASELARLEEAIGYRFGNRGLLDRALTHKSFAYEQVNDGGDRTDDYESLEFLGDAILGFIVAEFLFLTYSELTEGALTKLRSHLVSTRQLSAFSRSIDLGRYVRFSKGEAKTGGGQKKAILADVFESLVAAIYLDGGLGAARDFVLAQFRDRLAEIARGEVLLRDHKSALQETFHRLGRSSPRYRVIAESGPEHRKEFLVSVLDGGEEIARGRGRSKKEAEQQAAEAALRWVASAPPVAASGADEEVPEDGHSQNVVSGVGDDGRREAPSPEVEQPEK